MRFNAFNKYKNTKINTNLGTFDSKLELTHYNELVLREKAKQINQLKRQVRIKLGKNAKVHYVADFVFFDLSLGEWVIVDSKGFQTEAFKLKLKWLLDTYSNFRFELWKNKNREVFYSYDENNADFYEFIRNYKK